MNGFTHMPRICGISNTRLYIGHLTIMPICKICLNKSDSTPVGGLCSTCGIPPGWESYISTHKPRIHNKPKRVECISCGKDSGFNTKTVVNACWGKTGSGQNCFKCYSSQKNYNSGLSSFNLWCGGRDW